MRRRSGSLQANLCQAQQRDLKTIAPLSQRPIVLTDTIDYRTIGFLHYRPNPSKGFHYIGSSLFVAVSSLLLRSWGCRWPWEAVCCAWLAADDTYGLAGWPVLTGWAMTVGVVEVGVAERYRCAWVPMRPRLWGVLVTYYYYYYY